MGESLIDFRALRLGDLPRTNAQALSLKMRAVLMKPLTPKATLVDLVNPDKVDSALETAGIAIYAHPSGVYLLGCTSDRIHDHDRWLYVFQPTIMAEGDIYILASELEALPWGGALPQMTPIRQVALSARIEWANTVLWALTRFGYTGVLPTLGEVLAVQQSLPLGNDVTAQQWAHFIAHHIEIHRLLCHPNQQPMGTEALPQAVLLRMYGLGPWLEHAMLRAVLGAT